MSITNQVQTVVDYNLFLMEKSWDERNGEIRFSHVTPELVKDIFTRENINLVASQVNTRNWAKIKENVAPAEMNSNKKVPTDSEWLKGHHLPEELAENPKMLAFVKESKIYNQLAYYKHTFQIIDSKLSLLVDGKPIEMEQILKDFSLKKDGSDFYIIKNTTGDRYFYLEQGLTKHDPQKEIKPTRTLTPGETPKNYTAIFYGIKEGHTNSAGGLKRWDRHTYIGLKTPGGTFFTFGAISKGGITCPDPYAYLPRKQLEVEFPISEKQFKATLNIAAEDQAKNENFNILFKNCSTFGGKIAEHLNIPASAQTIIEENNTFEHRVKAYAYSREISKEVKKQVMDENASTKIENIVFSNLPKIILANENLDPTKKMFMLSALKLQEKEIKVIIGSILEDAKKDSEITLTEKFYNLTWDIFNATKNIEISHSNVLFKQLEEEKEKQQWEEKIEQACLSLKETFNSSALESN